MKKRNSRKPAGSRTGALRRLGALAAVLCLAALLLSPLTPRDGQPGWELPFSIPGGSINTNSTHTLPGGEGFSQSLAVSDPAAIPEYAGEDYVELQGNAPSFTEYDETHLTGEHYSELDALGRCGTAMAMLEQGMMPTEERRSIGMVRPSGWQTVKYPDLISDLYLYNRCHLIGYALTGQNANERNLITGTRYLNVSVMLPFEKAVAQVLDEGACRVLYRVTPYFAGDELVARGVEMEAYSVEDRGASVCYHVFCYNVQPGIIIDYRTGESWEE